MDRMINGVNDNRKPYFYKDDGQLTAYSFACGYVQSKEGDNKKVELYKDGVYHVRTFDKSIQQKWLTWDSFETLTEARRFYHSKRV